MKKNKKYIALFETSEDCKTVGVVFPDFSGCISSGDSYEDAYRMAHEALAFHVKGLKEDDEKIPEPRTLEQIKRNWEPWKEWKDNYNFTIGYITLLEEPEAYSTVTITLPTYLLNEIDAVSKKRSTFLAMAAKSYLGINSSPDNRYSYK